MDQSATNRHLEQSPFSTANYNLDTLQKKDIPEIIQLAKDHEQMIEWLIKQLHEAKNVCDEFHKENVDTETHLNRLRKIIEHALEYAKNNSFQNNQEQSVSNFSMDQDLGSQGTPYTPQEYFIQNINQLSDLTKFASEMCSKAVNQPSLHEDEVELRKGSEQFRQCEQFSDYQTNQHQQQQQIQQIMSENEEQHSLQDNDLRQQHERLKQAYYNVISKAKDKIKQCCAEQKAIDQQNVEQIKKEIKELGEIYKREMQQRFEEQLNLLKIRVKAIQENEKQSYLKKTQELTDKISQLEKQQPEQDPTKLQKQVKTLNKRNEQLEKENNKLNDKLTQKESEIQNLNQNLIQTNGDYDLEKQEFYETIEQLQRELQISKLNGTAIETILANQVIHQNQMLQTGDQTTNYLQQFIGLNQELYDIKMALGGDYRKKIDEQKQKINQLQFEIDTLKKESEDLQEKLRQNDSVAILNIEIKKNEQKDKEILDQQVKIRQQSSEIDQFRRTLKEIHDFINQQNSQQKQDYEIEYQAIKKLHLDGYFKLIGKSISLIYLGFAVYKQYLSSESRKVETIDKLILDLKKFSAEFDKKENEKLSDKHELDKLYKDQFKALDNFYQQMLSQIQEHNRDIESRNRFGN